MNLVPLYRSLGILLWAVIVIAGVGAAWRSGALGDSGDSGDAKPNTTSLVRYLLGSMRTVDCVDASAGLRVGDPVFFQSLAGDWDQIGYVSHVSPGDESPRHVALAWYASGLDPTQCGLSQYHSSGRLEDVVRMLLPEEKRLRIQQRLADAFRTHGEEISAAVVPLVEQSLKESLPLIEAELRASVVRHRRDVDAVAARLNRDVVQERLIPLAKDELLPIVKRHAEEPAEAIGRELWERASIWRFGWRALYDSTPIPHESKVKEEWQRFVDEEATEVLEEHMDELTVAVQRILVDAAADPEIRSALSQAMEVVASDAQTRALVRTLLQESILENQALRKKWHDIWTSDEAVNALAVASHRLEPIVRSIGDDIFGTREGGIDPDFARVLRNQILGKDRRWIVATQRLEPSNAEPVINVASESMVFPVVYLADDSNSNDAVPKSKSFVTPKSSDNESRESESRKRESQRGEAS